MSVSPIAVAADFLAKPRSLKDYCRWAITYRFQWKAPVEGMIAPFSAARVRHSIITPLARAKATKTTTAVTHLGTNHIDRFSSIIPPPEIHGSSAKHCEPRHDQFVANQQQPLALATLCDTLLPKLLSGELGVTTK